MITDQDTTATGRIVVGVDGSEASKSALRWAARMAPVVGGSLHAVIAWDYPRSYGWSMAVPDDWRPDLDADKLVQSMVDEVFGATRPAGLTVEVRQGHPSNVLVESARHAAMLVVGSRGHGGLTGVLLGSVSRACVEHARCPVLVVHDDPPAPPLAA